MAATTDPAKTADEEGGKIAVSPQKKKKYALEKTEIVYITIMVVAVLAIALALGLVFGLKQDDKVIEATRAPVMTTEAPSSAPSAAPTGVLDVFLTDLPEMTVMSLQSASSPQSRAFAWLHHHPMVHNMPQWRKRQLFALATLYYALEGPNWPSQIRDDWLLYDKSECLWYSSLFSWEGNFTLSQSDLRNLVPCTDNGEYQALSLSDLQLGDFLEAVVPPELTLLTALKTIRLNHNDLNGVLHTGNVIFSFPQLARLPNLQDIDLAGNRLSGQVPTQIGLLSNSLQRLRLDSNALTGTLPTQLGLLTALKELGLGENFFTGFLPSHLGLLTALERLQVGGNQLSGAIPEEVTALQQQHNLTVFDTEGNSFGR